HLHANVDFGPLLSENVFVQGFPGTNAQPKPAAKHGCGGRGGLSDDGGMHAHDWGRHSRSHAHALDRISKRAEHAPHKRALTLRADPRMKVITYPCGAKPELLRARSRAHDRGWREFFTGKTDTNLHTRAVPAVSDD